MKKATLKNTVLLSLVIISQLHAMFRGLDIRVDWFIFIDHTRRIDYAVMYASRYIIQLVLVYCLMYPKGISKKLVRFMLILSVLDLIHYFTLSSIGFGASKILFALGIYLIYNKFYVKSS